MLSLSIIMPCCNEEEAIRLLPERLFPTLQRLSTDYDVELILVDDGSTDGSWVQLVTVRDQAAPWRVILGRHPGNRGLGAAIRTGYGLASGQIVVTLDADGTYPFSIIEPLVAAVEADADVATASPYHRAGGVKGVAPWRLLFSRGASLCYQALVDRHIATYTAMVRAYRTEVLAGAMADAPGFLHSAMTLVEARRRGARVVEVPAILASRRVGISKARVAQITRSHLGYMRQIALLRLTGQFWLPDARSTGRDHERIFDGGASRMSPARRSVLAGEVAQHSATGE